jgi:hypothetical protein
VRLCRTAAADTRCRRAAERILALARVKSKHIACPIAVAGALADEVIEWAVRAKELWLERLQLDDGSFGHSLQIVGRPKSLHVCNAPKAVAGRQNVARRNGPCVDGSGLARAFFTRAAVVGAAMCSACSAVHVTAGHNALRGSGPGQFHAFDNAVARVGCPDRRIDRLCITCCLPFPTVHITPDAWRDLFHAASATGSL